jgi:hypothetical protein
MPTQAWSYPHWRKTNNCHWTKVACFQTLITWRKLNQCVTHTSPLMSAKKFHIVHVVGFLHISFTSWWKYILLQKPNQTRNEHLMVVHIDGINRTKRNILIKEHWRTRNITLLISLDIHYSLYANFRSIKHMTIDKFYKYKPIVHHHLQP